MWCIYAMEYYSAIKKNEILPFTTMWMELEGIMLRYLMVFDAVVNGIDSLISLSGASLVVDRNSTDFFMLIFCILNSTYE